MTRREEPAACWVLYATMDDPIWYPLAAWKVPQDTHTPVSLPSLPLIALALALQAAACSTHTCSTHCRDICPRIDVCPFKTSKDHQPGVTTCM